MRQGEPAGHCCSYACPCGEVVFSTTTLMYIEPAIDHDKKRAKIVLEMITEAWDSGDRSLYINAVDFERRLNGPRKRKSWLSRLFFG